MLDRRQARKDFKSQETTKGVFAVRSTPSGEVWVSASNHLNTVQNGLWFTLRSGTHLNRVLQAAWNTHGEAAFEFEILEEFDKDMSPLLLKDFAKERQKHWAAELGARPMY